MAKLERLELWSSRTETDGEVDEICEVFFTEMASRSHNSTRPPGPKVLAPPQPPAAGPSSTPVSSSPAHFKSKSRWFFKPDQLMNTPSFRDGIKNGKELMNRQGAAGLIQEMGQKLQVTQLCINTAIVYMQRFYMFHSFKHFHRSAMATATLFLAAKIEEQPRYLESLIRASNICQNREVPRKGSDMYTKQAAEVVANENILLQTLGFDVAVNHPHTHVVQCCQLVNAPKELAQTSYFMATNSLHLTTLCLQYPPTVVACVCIHLACQWAKYKIPKSKEGKEWFEYVDPHASAPLLDKLAKDFLAIYEKSPSRLKSMVKFMASSEAAKEKETGQSHSHSHSHYPSDKHKVKHKHRGKDHDHQRSKSSQETKTLEAPSIDQQLHQQPQQQQQRQRQPHHHRHHHNHHSQHNPPPLPPLPPPPKQPQQQPPPPPLPQQQPPPPPPHAPLKLKLKIPLEVDRKKRKNSNSSSEPVPVAKMSRVMGSAPDMEAIFFNNVL